MLPHGTIEATNLASSGTSSNNPSSHASAMVVHQGNDGGGLLGSVVIHPELLPEDSAVVFALYVHAKLEGSCELRWPRELRIDVAVGIEGYTLRRKQHVRELLVPTLNSASERDDVQCGCIVAEMVACGGGCWALRYKGPPGIIEASLKSKDIQDFCRQRLVNLRRDIINQGSWECLPVQWWEHKGLEPLLFPCSKPKPRGNGSSDETCSEDPSAITLVPQNDSSSKHGNVAENYMHPQNRFSDLQDEACTLALVSRTQEVTGTFGSSEALREPGRFRQGANRPLEELGKIPDLPTGSFQQIQREPGRPQGFTHNDEAQNRSSEHLAVQPALNHKNDRCRSEPGKGNMDTQNRRSLAVTNIVPNADLLKQEKLRASQARPALHKSDIEQRASDSKLAVLLAVERQNEQLRSQLAEAKMEKQLNDQLHSQLAEANAENEQLQFQLTAANAEKQQSNHLRSELKKARSTKEHVQILVDANDVLSQDNERLHMFSQELLEREKEAVSELRSALDTAAVAKDECQNAKSLRTFNCILQRRNAELETFAENEILQEERMAKVITMLENAAAENEGLAHFGTTATKASASPAQKDVAMIHELESEVHNLETRVKQCAAELHAETEAFMASTQRETSENALERLQVAEQRAQDIQKRAAIAEFSEERMSQWFMSEVQSTKERFNRRTAELEENITALRLRESGASQRWEARLRQLELSEEKFESQAKDEGKVLEQLRFLQNVHEDFERQSESKEKMLELRMSGLKQNASQEGAQAKKNILHLEDKSIYLEESLQEMESMVEHRMRNMESQCKHLKEQACISDWHREDAVLAESRAQTLEQELEKKWSIIVETHANDFERSLQDLRIRASKMSEALGRAEKVAHDEERFAKQVEESNLLLEAFYTQDGRSVASPQRQRRAVDQNMNAPLALKHLESAILLKEECMEVVPGCVDRQNNHHTKVEPEDQSDQLWSFRAQDPEKCTTHGIDQSVSDCVDLDESVSRCLDLERQSPSGKGTSKHRDLSPCCVSPCMESELAAACRLRNALRGMCDPC